MSVIKVFLAVGKSLRRFAGNNFREFMERTFLIGWNGRLVRFVVGGYSIFSTYIWVFQGRELINKLTAMNGALYLCLRKKDPPLPALGQRELHWFGIGNGACPQTRHTTVQTMAHICCRRCCTAHQSGYCKKIVKINFKLLFCNVYVLRIIIFGGWERRECVFG